MRISDWSSDVRSSDLVPTPGSKLSAKSSWPMPRMNPDNIDGELNICDVDDSCTPGVRFASCETLSTPFSCRAAPAKAATAIGTWWTFSARRSEDHTSELKSLLRNSYAVFCWQKKI